MFARNLFYAGATDAVIMVDCTRVPDELQRHLYRGLLLLQPQWSLYELVRESSSADDEW